MVRWTRLFAVLAVIGWAGVPGAHAGEGGGGTQILQKVHLDGDGGWDCLYCDSANRRLYVTHDTRVQVLDADTLKPVGTIEGTKRAHGVVTVPELNKGYITSGEDGVILVFDLKTLKVTGRIAASKDADAITYDPATRRVFSFNGDSGNATVVDAATDKVAGTLELGGKPEFAVADGKGYLFDNLEDKSEVLKINAGTLKIEKRWPLAPGQSPSGIALDARHHRLFSSCRNKTLVVMDTADGKVVRTLPIGEHVDGCCFNLDTKTVYSTCGDGTLSVIHEDSPGKFRVEEDAATEPGARTVALDTVTGHLFTATAKTGPPPAPTKDNPKPRRKILPGTFEVLMLGK